MYGMQSRKNRIRDVENMRCPFCDLSRISLPANSGDIHLIATKQGSNIHIHGPLDDKNQIIEFITHIIKQAKLTEEEIKNINTPIR